MPGLGLGNECIESRLLQLSFGVEFVHVFSEHVLRFSDAPGTICVDMRNQRPRAKLCPVTLVCFLHGAVSDCTEWN